MTSHPKILKLGLIGAGPWGRNYISTIKEMDGVALSRLASRNPESADLVDENCQITQDWQDVAQGSDLDGVIIATPPQTHAEIVKAAILAGNPVLVEKPLTLDLDEAKDLLAISKSHGGLVLVDHIHLFSSPWQALKSEAKTLGPVRAIVSWAGRIGPFRQDTSVLWDWGPHDVAMCCDLLDQVPNKVQAILEESRQTFDGAGETIKLEMNFGENCFAEVNLSNLLEKPQRYFSVFFDDCALVYDDFLPHKLSYHALLKGSKGPLGPAEPLPIEDEKHLNRLIRFFGASIQSNSRDDASLRLGVDVVEILTKAQNSIGPSPCVE